VQRLGPNLVGKKKKSLFNLSFFSFFPQEAKEALQEAEG